MAKRLTQSQIKTMLEQLEETTLYAVIYKDHTSCDSNSDSTLLEPAILVCIGLFLGETQESINLYTEYEPTDPEWKRHKRCILKSDILKMVEIK